MAQSEHGSPGPIEVYADSQYDPMQSWEQERHYRGYPADLVLLGNEFIANGWRARTESTGSQWAKLIVSIPNDGNEDFIDRYEFNIDFKQQDLFVNIAINAFLTKAGFDADGITDLRSFLAESLTSNEKIATVRASYHGDAADAAGSIYQMLVMGQDFIEVAQPVLARKRTYANAFTGTLMSTQKTQTVFSTKQLISTFGIPDEVSAQITADPITAPMVNYAYGWKMRKNNLVIIPAKNKIEEQVDWVWDQWSTISYNHVADAMP